MVDIAIKNAAAYAARYELSLGERLGFGIHLVDVSPSNIAFLD